MVGEGDGGRMVGWGAGYEESNDNDGLWFW